MNWVDRILILSLMFTLCVFFMYNRVIQGLTLAVRGWRHNPARMIVKILLSFVIGQGVFWLLGYDQLGFFMSPMKQFGLGQGIAAVVAHHLPTTVAIGATFKAIEIVSDAVRIPLEGALYRRQGFTPDIVATLFTQPLWTCFEVAEKITGVFVRPELIGTPGQITLSIACVYGNLFRYILDVIYLKKGEVIYRFTGLPVERAILRLARR